MRRALALVIFLSAVSVSFAEEAKEEECDGSTYEMVQCLMRLTRKWDARLNTAYQEALKSADNPKQGEQLRAAQRLWIQYRDANCMYYGLGDGTIARIQAGLCHKQMTEARAKELEDTKLGN